MIKNLLHALTAAALILATGLVLGTSWAAQELHSHKDAKFAVVGLFAVLILFVAVSLVRAFARPKPQGRSGLPYAARRK